MTGSSRGQAHTVEAIVAALLLMTSLAFALQVTVVTPLSASTSSQHIENQQEAVASGVLATAAEDGSLKRAILYWDDSSRTFHDTAGSREYFTNSVPNNRFGDLLRRAFGGRGIAYNVYVVSQTDTNGDGFPDGTEEQRLVYQGEPSDNGVSVSRTIALYDCDTLYQPDADADGKADATGVRLSSSCPIDSTQTTLYNGNIEDFSPGSDLYNVVRVEVVVWRM